MSALAAPRRGSPHPGEKASPSPSAPPRISSPSASSSAPALPVPCRQRYAAGAPHLSSAALLLSSSATSVLLLWPPSKPSVDGPRDSFCELFLEDGGDLQTLPASSYSPGMAAAPDRSHRMSAAPHRYCRLEERVGERRDGAMAVGDSSGHGARRQCHEGIVLMQLAGGVVAVAGALWAAHATYWPKPQPTPATPCGSRASTRPGGAPLLAIEILFEADADKPQDGRTAASRGRAARPPGRRRPRGCVQHRASLPCPRARRGPA